ncbi:MAG: metal-sensitive transcriptional regulator [Clostridiales bacterium]|nr:metal-sensitive transcriptional regulator [Clostridiales bacterium]SCN21512.1 Copper-sensitive operon repressor [Clostridium sp. N3C]
MKKENLKKDIVVRLRRIQGQVKGIEKMVSGEVCCRDVLVQIAAVRAANNKAGALLLKNFAKNCMIGETSEDTSKNMERLVSTLLLFLRSGNIKERKTSSENLKEEIVKKLQEIQGQVEGIEKMIQFESCCQDILVQFASVRENINEVGVLLVENYAQSCLITDDEEVTNKNIDDLISTMLSFLK